MIQLNELRFRKSPRFKLFSSCLKLNLIGLVNIETLIALITLNMIVRLIVNKSLDALPDYLIEVSCFHDLLETVLLG